MPDTRFKKVYTFNSARKSMSTIIPLDSGGFRVYTKGASEIIMKKCSFLVGEGGKIEAFTAAHQDRLVQTVIEPMAKDGLRTISLAYRDFVPGKAERNQVHYDPGTGKENIWNFQYSVIELVAIFNWNFLKNSTFFKYWNKNLRFRA